MNAYECHYCGGKFYVEAFESLPDYCPYCGRFNGEGEWTMTVVSNLGC